MLSNDLQIKKVFLPESSPPIFKKNQNIARFNHLKTLNELSQKQSVQKASDSKGELFSELLKSFPKVPSLLWLQRSNQQEAVLCYWRPMPGILFKVESRANSPEDWIKAQTENLRFSKIDQDCIRLWDGVSLGIPDLHIDLLNSFALIYSCNECANQLGRILLENAKHDLKLTGYGEIHQDQLGPSRQQTLWGTSPDTNFSLNVGNHKTTHRWPTEKPLSPLFSPLRELLVSSHSNTHKIVLKGINAEEFLGWPIPDDVQSFQNYADITHHLRQHSNSELNLVLNLSENLGFIKNKTALAHLISAAIKNNAQNIHLYTLSYHHKILKNLIETMVLKSKRTVQNTPIKTPESLLKRKNLSYDYFRIK